MSLAGIYFSAWHFTELFRQNCYLSLQIISGNKKFSTISYSKLMFILYPQEWYWTVTFCLGVVLFLFHTDTIGHLGLCHLVLVKTQLYLWLGGGQSEPYSWTCIPKKHKSTPSISSKAKRALVRYGKDSAISPLSTNLHKVKSTVFLMQIAITTTSTWTQTQGGTAYTLLSCQAWLPQFCQTHGPLGQWLLQTRGDSVASGSHWRDSPERCQAW